MKDPIKNIIKLSLGLNEDNGACVTIVIVCKLNKAISMMRGNHRRLNLFRENLVDQP